MERLTTRMHHRPAMYTFTICQTTDCYSFTIIGYQQLVYIALTTLQIRRLLLDDVESANVQRFSEFLHFQCLERKCKSREPLRNKIEFQPHSKPIFRQ